MWGECLVAPNTASGLYALVTNGEWCVNQDVQVLSRYAVDMAKQSIVVCQKLLVLCGGNVLGTLHYLCEDERVQETSLGNDRRSAIPLDLFGTIIHDSSLHWKTVLAWILVEER